MHNIEVTEGETLKSCIELAEIDNTVWSRITQQLSFN